MLQRRLVNPHKYQARIGRRIEIRAPLPPELVNYLAALGRATKADPAVIDAALREFL